MVGGDLPYPGPVCLPVVESNLRSPTNDKLVFVARMPQQSFLGLDHNRLSQKPIFKFQTQRQSRPVTVVKFTQLLVNRRFTIMVWPSRCSRTSTPNDIKTHHHHRRRRRRHPSVDFVGVHVDRLIPLKETPAGAASTAAKMSADADIACLPYRLRCACHWRRRTRVGIGPQS